MDTLPILEVLLVAGAQAAGLALFGVGLFHLHRRVGVWPFTGLVAILGAAVPATVHQDLLVAGSLGAVPLAQAVGAPVVIALVVLLHLLRGARTALLVGGSILLATVLLALPPLLTGTLDGGIWGSMLAQDPLLPAGAGVSLWVATLAAIGVLYAIFSYHRRANPLAAGVFAFLAGTVAHGLSLVVVSGVGAVTAETTLRGVFLPQLVIGVLPAAAVTLYATARLSGISPEVRQALISGSPLSQDPLAEARDLEATFETSKSEEQREADALLDLVERAEHGAYVCNEDGLITYANGALASILGQPGSELEGVNVRHVFGGTDERGRPRFADFPVEPGRHRTRIQLPDGTHRAIEVEVQSAGENRCYGRVRDRTEEVLREQMEEQKERAEFYVDLLRHDIGNHVTAPLNYLQLVERHEELPDDVRGYVESSRIAVEAIADLLDRIDVLSDVDEMRPEPVDAGRILERVGRRFASKHRDLDVELRLPEGPVPVAGTPLLDEVFGNLVANAVRHAGEDATLELGARREGTTWVLWVADDGPGIPDEAKATIFDRSTHDESAGGKGLGLYIVKTVTNAVGGEVLVEDRVEGRPGEGARFEVHLDAVGADRLPEGSQALDHGDDAAVA